MMISHHASDILRAGDECFHIFVDISWLTQLIVLCQPKNKRKLDITVFLTKNQQASLSKQFMNKFLVK